MRVAKTSAGPICQHADVSVVLPLNQLVATARSDNMQEALARGIDTLASGVTLLWRILEKPGYIRLDEAHLHQILKRCGRAQFATATAMGPDRARTVLANLAEHPLIKTDASRPPVRTMLVGVLAGDDLRLSEISTITSGLSAAFGPRATLELGTVNDETTFSGRLSVVMLLFEEGVGSARADDKSAAEGGAKQGFLDHKANSRFRHAEKTLWHNEDLDVPTFMRKQLTLDR